MLIINYLNSRFFKKICFYILNIFFFFSLHSQQLKTHYDEGVIPLEKHKDSIFTFLQKTKTKALLKKDTTLLIRSLITLSRFERYNLNYNKAFAAAGEALFISEEYKNLLLRAKSNEELGVLTYLYKQDEESENYLKKAHQLYKQLYQEKKTGSTDLFKSYYNMVLHYQRISNSQKLQAYIDTCVNFTKDFKVPKIYQIYLNEKKASIKDWNKEFEEALNLLQSAALALENNEPNSDLKESDKSFLLILYGRIASVYKKLGNLNKASEYFEKFSKIDGVLGETTFYRSFLYSTYAEVLKEQGFYKKAYEFEQKSNMIGNVYLNPRNEKNKDFFTIKNRYKEELTKKKAQLNLKNLELAKKQEDILRFRITLFIIGFLIILTSLIVRQRIKNFKFQKQQQSSEELLSIKNKELTSNTLHLIEKEQVINKLKNYIKESSTDNKSKMILKSIERSSDSLWDSFNRRFNELNKGFYERLSEKVPDLGRADRKLCALIKLNFTGKEMAYLLGISLGSVHVARHRLRKKMNLDRNQNLTKFINSI